MVIIQNTRVWGVPSSGGGAPHMCDAQAPVTLRLQILAGTKFSGFCMLTFGGY